jgi:hypothetical protein
MAPSQRAPPWAPVRRACALAAVLLSAVATTPLASHVREGKGEAYHDGHLRYRAAQPYAEGSCGFPQVIRH